MDHDRTLMTFSRSTFDQPNPNNLVAVSDLMSGLVSILSNAYLQSCKLPEAQDKQKHPSGLIMHDM